MKSDNNFEKFHFLSAETGNANFGDARLSARVEAIADALLAKPSESFPDAVGDQ
jgi:Transposase DNA-binding